MGTWVLADCLPGIPEYWPGMAGVSPQRRHEIEVVLGSYESLLTDIAYLSVPITSGERLYRVLEENGVTTVADLSTRRPNALREEVIEPNITEAIAKAKRLAPAFPTRWCAPRSLTPDRSSGNPPSTCISG